MRRRCCTLPVPMNPEPLPPLLLFSFSRQPRAWGPAFAALCARPRGHGPWMPKSLSQRNVTWDLYGRNLVPLTAPHLQQRARVLRQALHVAVLLVVLLKHGHGHRGELVEERVLQVADLHREGSST